MQLAELAEEKPEREDARDHRDLRRLEGADARQTQPAFRAAVLFAQARVGEDDEDDAHEVHRQRGPFHPAIVDQARDEENDDARRTTQVICLCQ